MGFSKNLANLQSQRGESNYKLAKILGVSQTSVANWREGRNIPHHYCLEKLAEHFGCTVDELLHDNAPREAS